MRWSIYTWGEKDVGGGRHSAAGPGGSRKTGSALSQPES